MRRFIRSGISWIPLGIAITILCGLVYATVQQNYRQSLNDPQIQMAEDAASALEQGASPSSIVPTQKVNIAESLAPWIAVYDASGAPIVASGVLDGMMPTLPHGVFDIGTWHTYAEYRIPLPVSGNEDRFTWQPRDDVRQAVVLVHTSNGMFVASGRNMREVENREGALELMIGVGWLATLAVTFVAQLFAQYLLCVFHEKKRGT
ncbi:MAG TPA: hypothetical protein VMU13_02725 [Candidatus Paceibacterota bacterium]|nr:hypothetical protein [Candidatus Paceibacterota bacterium]